MRALSALPLMLAAGCWKATYAEIPPDVLRFEPPVEAPRDWLLAPFEVGLECPDGANTRFHVLYPESATPDGEPMPAAVLYHSGAFDFVYAPKHGDPLSGTHFASPSRLGSEFAVRQVFATLGMYPDLYDVDRNDGLLAAALAEAGVAVMLPANCWGDLWGNETGGPDNDFPQDLFDRQGRAAAEWALRFLVDPLFASAFDLELPIAVDPTQVYALGLGEGGRAVAEVLSIDNDEDGVPDYELAGALVDSPPDDLRVFFDDAGLYGSTVEGLLRVFPDGPDATASGSMWAAPLPERVAYVYPGVETLYPDAVHDAGAAAVAAAGGWVYESPTPGHGVLNGGDDTGLARAAVQYLLTGERPPMR